MRVQIYTLLCKLNLLQANDEGINLYPAQQAQLTANK